MKKTVLVMAMAGIAMMFFVGCASIQTAQKFNGQKIDLNAAQEVAHINGDNWGIYCLWIPLFAGSTEKIGSVEFLGADNVKVGPVVDLVTAESKKMGATKTLDIQSSASSSYIPPVFFFKEVQVSGNAVK